MSFLPIIVIVSGVILAMYFLMNKKTEEADRAGVVKDILKKDTLSVDFGDGRPVVVKLFGISPASEAEMLDDKIFAFLEEALRGRQVEVKPIVVDSSELMRAEVRTTAGEYVNAVLVRRGFARWVASEASGDKELSEAQSAAKVEQLGIWNPAIVQLLEDKKKSGGNAQFSDDEIANMTVDPNAEDERS